MIKKLLVLSLFILLLSTVESKQKVLKIVTDIEDQMVRMDDLEEIKDQIVNEVVDSLVPVIEGSCTCCDEADKECHAILIAGGLPEPYVNNSVQVLNHDGTYMCDLPDIPGPYGRYGATMDGNILCGGRSNGGPLDLRRNCIFYDGSSGLFGNPADDVLDHDRWHSTSWGRPDPPSWVDSSHIFGSNYSPMDTSEIAYEIGSTPGQTYSPGNYGQCSIQLMDYVVIIGGAGGALTDVVKIFDGSPQVSLPSLNQGRGYAGCGFYNDGSNLVYLVTGGYDGDCLNSTEISINEGPWSLLSGTSYLPSARIGLRGVSLNNEIFMIGGWNFCDSPKTAVGEVLRWDKTTMMWNYISDIDPRFFHTVSVLPCKDVKKHCLSTIKNSATKTETVDIEKVDGSI